MRKSFFLTLLLTLCCTLTAWANTTTFKPDSDKAYALKVKDTNPALFLDIQSNTDDTKVRLSNSPCAIYFSESKDYSNCWDIKDKNNNYVYFANGTNYPQTGANSQQQCWVFTETNNAYTINAWDCYLYGEKINGAIVYIQYQYSYPLEFTLEEFVEQTQKTYTLNIKGAPAGASVTYNGQTVANGETITIKGTVDVSLFDATDIEGYTWSVVVNGTTITLTYTKKVEGDKALNGYYYINYNDQPLFIGYNEVMDEWNTEYANNGGYKGYKILGGEYTTDAEASKLFVITPSASGTGYTIAAQGKYLQSPEFNTWRHIQFSDEASAAGAYLFHSQPNFDNAFKIQGVGRNEDDENDPNHWIHNDYLEVYGGSIVGPNPEQVWDKDNKEYVYKASIFTLTPATTYTVVIPEKGYLPLCLPFNVILPTNVEAYDIKNMTNLLERIDNASQRTLLAGTPVILKANPGSYVLEITMITANSMNRLDGSLLRGNYVKQTLQVSNNTKKFILNGETFEAILNDTDIPANSCWIEASDINDDDIELNPKTINIEGWIFRVKETGNNGLKITGCLQEGSNGNLVIGSTYEVDGVNKDVIAISDNLLAGNQKLTTVTLPATLTSVGSGYANYMFDYTYSGADIDAGKNIGGDNQDEAEAYISKTAHPCKYKILGTSTWRMTATITIARDENSKHFNNFGSCLLATKANTLANDYNDGSMQLYLRKDKSIVFKLNSTGDTHVYNTNNKFNLPNSYTLVFVLENDGAGGYIAKMTYGDGITERFEVLADGKAKLADFNTIWSSLGEGISVNVKFEKLTNKGLFVGCKNLTAIHVAEGNQSFMGCHHGVLYNSSKTHIIRFPEGGGTIINDRKHFETPSSVTMVYAGALHDVDADITFHSNPLIMHVDHHEDNQNHMRANYYLSLEDANATDFVSANENTFLTARYERAALAAGAYGTITLPFVPTTGIEKYDFFEFVEGDNTSLTFLQVSQLKANTPYLYKLKDGVTATTGNDVFATDKETTIAYMAPYTPDGTWKAVGTYTNDAVITKDYPNSYYYYYSASQKKFLRVTEKLNYRPYRAFFVKTSMANEDNIEQAATLSLRFKDGSTQVIAPSQVEGWEETIYYDLMGRRVMSPTNGIYIVNGKKVIL